MPSYIIYTHTRYVLIVAHHASQWCWCGNTRKALCWRKFCYFRVWARARVRHGLWRCRRCSHGHSQAAGRDRRLEGRRGRCARRRAAAAQDGMGQCRPQAGQAPEQAHGAAAPVRLVPHVLPPARLGHLPPCGGGPLARGLHSGGDRVLCEQVRCLQRCPM